MDGQTKDDASLFLIHLHRVDYNFCLARHQQRSSLPWNQRDIDENWGYQNRITEPEQFNYWFYHDSSSESQSSYKLVAGKHSLYTSIAGIGAE